MSDSSPSLMRLQDVTVHVGPAGPQGIRALDEISLTVDDGECVGLMGASGSGKSTLLHVLCGLIKPTAGQIDVSESVAMPSLVFQFPENQLFSETVADDVGYGLREGGLSSEQVLGRVNGALEEVGLPPQEFRGRVPFHLSGGERRRVALAGALAQQRQLLLLDEPTLALDVQGVRHLRQVLNRRRERGVGYWIASHDADFLESTCSQLVVLQEGRSVYQGEAAAFWADAERSRSLGVRCPRSTSFRERLVALGAPGLSPYPDENELVTALAQLRKAAP